MTKSEKILQRKLEEQHFEEIIPLRSPIFRTVESAMEEYAKDFHEKKLRIKKDAVKIKKFNEKINSNDKRKKS